MQNMTDFPENVTSHKNLSVIIKVCVVIPFFFVFLCCIVIMLHIFAHHRQFLDNSRYILFAYMLINDTVQLLSSVLLFLFVMAKVKFALVYCVPLLVISTATFQNTPLILATMSLERYVAIFYPLQRPAAWRSDRIWIITLSLWLISCIFPIIDHSIGKHDPAVDVFSTRVLCKATLVNSSPIQTLFKAAVSVLFFAVVAVIILFTYVRILLETRKLRQDRMSVSKAMHTVLLHGFQLLLCVLAFTSPITETLIVLHANWLPEDISFFNYFCFILIPRFLSPLIYGFRDQSLRGYIGKTFLSCSNKIKPCIRGKLQDNLPTS
uniref:odorant receptor 129-1 n=1 Tax=Scatophagus argus TaxID=75038 RepID=UPI001ED7F179|nr:odorant receptor 129-1 [Scatophagus argus]